MRAQNEPPETVVRLGTACGDGAVDGRAGSGVPGRAARRARRRARRSPTGRVWPQSRGSQLAGLVVGARAGERVLDLCAAPGGKATQLAGGEVVAVEKHPGRARELERELPARSARPTCASSSADALELPPELTRLRPRARRRALLGPRRARRAARPALARPSRCRSSSATSCASRPSASEPGGTVVYSVCTINADENEAVVDATGLEAEPLGDEWPQFAHPRRPEFLLTLPHRAPHLGLLHRPPEDRRSGVTWDDWIRTVEVEPSLYAADFARLGEQVEVLLRAGARVFHFDVGDGRFVPPITMGPIVLAVDRARSIHDAGRRARLPPDGREPRAALRRSSRSPAPTASPSTSRRARDLPARVAARARARASRSGWRSTRSTGVAEAAAAALEAERRPRALHEHPPRLLRTGVHPRVARARARAARQLLPPFDARAGRRRRRPGQRRASYATRERRCSSRRRRSSAARICRARTGGSSEPWREPRAGARARRAGARDDVDPNPVVGAVVAREGEVVGEGWHAERAGARMPRSSALAAAGERARGATLYVYARAVLAPRHAPRRAPTRSSRRAWSASSRRWATRTRRRRPWIRAPRARRVSRSRSPTCGRRAGRTRRGASGSPRAGRS